METIAKLIGWIIGLILLLGPWMYHIVYCFQNKEYVLLLVGVIVAPIGWLHGLGAIFGWW